MKNNKARDAHGHVYEIFKFGGDYLKDSQIKMFNMVHIQSFRTLGQLLKYQK